MVLWLDAVLRRLALRPDVLLTVALDPDALSLTEPILVALREMGSDDVAVRLDLLA